MSRIIAGLKRGHRLAMPTGDRTRPTTDRVREALFSALASWAGTSAEPPERAMADLAVCDLFAGSGAIGLEAASRGAARVVLIEADRRTASVAAGNARTLGLAVEVLTGRVEQVLQRDPGTPFDVVFADPPYERPTAEVEAMLSQLLDSGWVASNGLVVLERSIRSQDPAPPPECPTVWTRDYGETRLIFLAR
jgi:16S rRNA (guanine966-N2)-methyltransferase